jgi:hypothetical protein
MNPEARLTKQGVRDLNFYGPRQARPGREGPSEGIAGPATAQTPATPEEEPRVAARSQRRSGP